MKSENGNIHDPEVDNIQASIRRDKKLEIMKYKQDVKYVIGEHHVQLGTIFAVHPAAYVKDWLKFRDGKLIERKSYKVALGERPPDRDELDEPEMAYSKNDPWSLHFLLPMENDASGEVCIFSTNTVGGKAGVIELCDAWVQRAKTEGKKGRPIVKLGEKEMPTAKQGVKMRPFFEITGWDDEDGEALEVNLPVQKAVIKRDDMDDEIPF